MKTLFILASMMAVLFLAAPNEAEAQKRKAATPSAESSVNAYFRYRVTTESGGALSPAGFRKTNGYEQGYGLYVMEWQAEVLFQQDGYKAGDFFVGYWQNFRVLQQKPGTLDSLIVGNTILFNKGTMVRLTGNATLRKTEKGWRLEGFEVKTSQVTTPPMRANNRFDSPTAAYKRLFAAVKSKNTEAIKKQLTKKSIDFGAMAAQRNNTPLEKVYEKGFTATTLSEKMPNIRDERISGEMGAVEVWNSKDNKWEDLPFMLEDGVWKLAIGELFDGTFKSPGK